MDFAVDVTEPAELDADQYVTRVLRQSNDAEAAGAWLAGLQQAVGSLRSMPTRCAIVPEQGLEAEPLRQLLYHSHRIIFHVNPADRIVTVLRIYHSSREPLAP